MNSNTLAKSFNFASLNENLQKKEPRNESVLNNLRSTMCTLNTQKNSFIDKNEPLITENKVQRGSLIEITKTFVDTEVFRIALLYYFRIMKHYQKILNSRKSNRFI